MKPIEEEWSTDMLNCALGCFAVYLATGHTIYCKSIKASTLRLYLTAAAGLIQKIDPVPRNAMNDDTGKQFIGITRVLNEVRRIETVPDRKEGYTIAMQKHVSNRAQLSAPDALPRIMANWGAAALSSGFRRQEWCQKRGAGLLHNIQDCLFNRPRAFILDDVEFYRTGHTCSNWQSVRKCQRNSICEATVHVVEE